MFSVSACIAFLALASASAPPDVPEAPFEMVVRTTDDGAVLESVSGCRWEELTFSSTDVPHRAVVTDRGVRVVSRDFRPDDYVSEDGIRFAFLMEAMPDGFTAVRLAGCRWESIEFNGAAGECRATLTARGVEGIGN